MSASLVELEREALRLSEAERARLAYELLESLQCTSDDESVLDTVRRRAAELESGEVQAVPAEDVFLKARALLR